MKWICTVCGYVHNGDEAPEKCPVCGAGKKAFAPVENKAEKNLDDYVKAQMDGEAWEVVNYIAASYLADKLGYADVAGILRQIADEEAWHGANYVYRSGALGQDKEALVEFVKKMINAELGAHKMKTEGYELAKAAGKDELASLFKLSAEDEFRHAQMWKRALALLEA